MKRNVIGRSIACLMLLCLAARARAADATVQFTQDVLDNGLRVIYAPMKNAPVVHVRVIYHVGSKDEKPDRQGFAHMFEHMMFRGSAHVRPEEHMRLIQTVGGYSNAFTSFDQTVYVNTLPANQLQLALWLEADRMASFKVSEDIYKTERKVVMEEWGRRQNQPYGTLFEDFLKLAFTTHSYRWTPIGNMDHLLAAGVDDLQEFFNTYYVPNNATLVIAGDIDVDAARKLVNSYLAWIPKAPAIKRLAEPEPAQNKLREEEIARPVPLPAILVGYHLPGYKSEDQPALDLLSSILSAGNSARLDQLLVNGKEPLCNRVSASNTSLEDSGMLTIIAIVLMGKDPAKVEQLIKEEIERVRDNGVTDEELAKAKTAQRVGQVTSRQTAEQIASALGHETVFGGDANRVNTDLARHEAVTAADVQAVAKKYLTPSSSTILRLKPDIAAMMARRPVTQPTTAPVAPSTRKIEPRAVSFPADYPTTAPMSKDLIKVVFNKGQESTVGAVKVITMTDPRLPLVTWSLTLRRGSHAETTDKAGLGGMTTALMERGSADLKYLDWSRDLESRGISLGVSDGGDFTRISGSALVDQLEHAFTRTRHLLLEPRFEAEEFAKLKEQTLNDLKQGYENPETVASMELGTALFAQTPLGRRATPKTVGSVTVEDIKAFYKELYRPDDAILVIAGDITLQRAEELARKLLAGWGDKPTGELPKVDYALPPAPAKRRIVVVDRPEGKQSMIRMAIRAYDIRSDEKYAGAVMDRILSHGIDSRLGRYVRAQKGLAYSVYAMFSPERHAGQFTAGTETSFKTTAEAVEAMFKVFGDMRKDNVTDAELSETKLRIAGAMVMGMQTIQQQASYRTNGILNGYPIDYYDQYPQRIGQVSADQIRAVAEKYIHDEAMTVVVVAPASAVAEQLKALGEVEVVPMPLRREATTQPK